MSKSMFDKDVAHRGIATFNFKPEDLVIVKDPKHPLYCSRVERPLIQSFIDELDADGFIQPVVVCRDSEGQAVVVAGRRRVRAALTINERRKKQGRALLMVPCIVRRGSMEALSLIVVAENAQREDDPLIVKAEKAARLCNQGHSLAEIGLAFGVEPQTIRNWLKLTELAPAVHKALVQEQITPYLAVQLHGLSEAEQKASLAQILAEAKDTGKAPTARTAARHVATRTGRKTGPRMRTRKEIQGELENGSRRGPEFRAALRWVLNEDGAEAV